MELKQASQLLEPGYLGLESGVARLPDGQLHVAVWTTLPGCKGRMVEWWFEMRSRFWLGDFDPAETAPDRGGEGLLRHCREEMTDLAGFLPDLYAREA